MKKKTEARTKCMRQNENRRVKRNALIIITPSEHHPFPPFHLSIILNKLLLENRKELDKLHMQFNKEPLSTHEFCKPLEYFCIFRETRKSRKPRPEPWSSAVHFLAQSPSRCQETRHWCQTLHEFLSLNYSLLGTLLALQCTLCRGGDPARYDCEYASDNGYDARYTVAVRSRERQ